MGKMLDKVVEAGLARVKICEQRILALDVAMQAVWNRRHSGFNKDTEAAERAFRVLRGFLYQDLAKAYSDVFMWGNLAGKKAHREAEKLAFRQFLSEQHAIIQYLQFDTTYPGSWKSKTEQDFRKEIEQLKQEGKQ